MKRPRSKPPLRITREIEKLLALANALPLSGSRLEDRYCETQISRIAAKMVQGGNEDSIEAMLDHTFEANRASHDILIECFEAVSETVSIEKAGKTWDVLLISIPVVAWSKYSLPTGVFGRDSLDAILAHLHGHVLAREAKAAMVPYLYSIDQMARGFVEVHKLAVKLGESAITGTTAKFDYARFGETAPLLADSRFLVAGIAVEAGGPIFRWQEVDEKMSRADCLEHWIAQCRPSLSKLLPGCTFECLLPDAYFVNARESDRRVRPYAIRAGVAFLESALKTTAPELHAIVSGVGEAEIEEYRVAFTLRNSDEVLHGTVWPLFGGEGGDAEPKPLVDIEAVLKECKVGKITVLPGTFAPEFCEDCGAPLFADADSDMAHPELPEEAVHTTSHYH